MYRDVKTSGFLKSLYAHRADCRCEACGPAYLIFLTEYEVARLLQMLEKTAGDGKNDTGDFHSQIRQKLTPLIDNEQRQYFGLARRDEE